MRKGKKYRPEKSINFNIPPMEPNNLLRWMKYDDNFEDQMVTEEGYSLNEFDIQNQVARKFRIVENE